MTKVTRVISQLILSIMISTPMMVVTAVMIWVRLWFRLWDRVSTSLVTRESTSPWVPGIEVFHGQAADFLGQLPPHVIGDLLGNAGHNEALKEGKRGAEDIQPQHKQQDFADPAEIDAAALHAGHLGDEAVHHFRNRFAQNIGAQHHKSGAGSGENHNGNDRDAVFPEIFQQLFEGALEILGLFAGHVHAAHRP